MIDLLILLVLTDSEEEEQSLGHAQISNVKKQCYVCVWRAFCQMGHSFITYTFYYRKSQ